MGKEFWGDLLALILIIVIGSGLIAVVVNAQPAKVSCNPAGGSKHVSYILPDGYDLNFKNPYNVIDTDDGLDVIFHFSKED